MTTSGDQAAILVVEDERAIARAVIDRLRAEGFATAEASADGVDGVNATYPLSLDPARRLVSFEGRPVHLTPTEFDLLHALQGADGAVLTRLQLLNRVWGYSDGSGARTVDSHIRSIRRKTDDDVIRTVHGVGYSIGDVLGRAPAEPSAEAVS